MENSRDYIAFISYRHCPLDIRIAETLHRMIERYRVPRELRRDGEKSLGTVFRDRDELPLSNNLTQDIYDALDHSQFLIVVCTPDTPKSQWVEREIEYFISKHGRDRVLTVLAAGTPEESIPRRITHDYAEDGSVIAEYEPLCAYLVDPSEKNILKNLKKEFLRLIAAMLNCPYDALRQRQKRYRMQQLTALMGVVTAIALVFILMLGNRNREISNKNQEISQKNEEISIINQQIAEQLLQTQINETNALALLSQQQLAAGDRIGAIESALNALPHDNDGRPYSPDAEYALSQALNPYGNGKPAFHLTIEQPMDIHMMDVSDDGKYLVTLDVVGCIRCFDVDTAKMLWQYQLADPDETVYNAKSDAILLEIAEDQNRVVYSDEYNSYLLSLVSGELVHQLPFHAPGIVNSATLSLGGKWLVQSSRPTRFKNGQEIETPLYEIWDTETGESVHRIWPDRIFQGDLSDPVFNEDCTKMAFVMHTTYRSEMWLTVWDTTNWKVQYEYFIDPILEGSIYSSQIHPVWLPNGELILYYTQEVPDNFSFYQASIHKFDSEGNEIASQQYQFEQHIIGIPQFPPQIGSTHLFLVCSRIVLSIDQETCEVEYAYMPPDFHDIVASYLASDERLVIVLDDGSAFRLYQQTEEAYEADYPILKDSLVLACGKKQAGEIICTVTEIAPNAVSIIRSIQNKDTIDLPHPNQGLEGNKVYYYKIVPFPSGNFFLSVGGPYKNQHNISVDLYSIHDAHTAEILDSFELPYQTSLEIFTGNNLRNFTKYELVGFSEDENKIVFTNCTYDVTTHTLTEGTQENDIPKQEITSRSDNYLMLKQQAAPAQKTKVRSTGYLDRSSKILYWWTDNQKTHQVELPYDDSYYFFSESDFHYEPCGPAEIGGSGLIVIQVVHNGTKYSDPSEYFIYSTTDDLYRILPSQTNVPGTPGFAIGNSKKTIAFADYDQVLRIYDFDSNSIIHEWSLPFSPSRVEKMLYIADDQYLLIYTDGGSSVKMTVIDTRDGSVVGEFFLDRYYFSSSYNDIVQTDPNHSTLVIKKGDLDDTGIVIDMKTWTVTAEIPEFDCYLPGAGKIANRRHYDNSCSTTPIYSWEELAEMGWELVNTVKENKLD